MSRVFDLLVSLVVLASRVACLIVIAWFVVFAVDQSKAASVHQQNEVTESEPRTPAAGKRSTATKDLDKAARFLTRPFHGLATHFSNVWLAHGVDLVLVLLVYGFAVGFVARLVRVRV